MPSASGLAVASLLAIGALIRGSAAACVSCNHYKILAAKSGCSSEDQWCEWAEMDADGDDPPPTTWWLHECFPNATIDVNDGDLSGCSNDRRTDCPAGIKSLFSREERLAITLIGYANQCNSQWGSQIFLPLFRAEGDAVAGIALRKTVPGAGRTSCLRCNAYEIMAAESGCGTTSNWCSWSSLEADGPPTTAWVRKCFPNAQVDVSDDDLTGCDAARTVDNTECPEEVTRHFSEASREAITRVSFEDQCGSLKWGDQLYLRLFRGEEEDHHVAGIVLRHNNANLGPFITQARPRHRCWYMQNSGRFSDEACREGHYGRPTDRPTEFLQQHHAGPREAGSAWFVVMWVSIVALLLAVCLMVASMLACQLRHYRRQGSQAEKQPLELVPPQMIGDSQSVPVKVPAGKSPGDEFLVQDPATGAAVQVAVPRGAQPGQTIQVLMPAASSSASATFAVVGWPTAPTQPQPQAAADKTAGA